MNQIHADIEVPALGICEEFLLPADLPVQDVIAAVAKQIAEKNGCPIFDRPVLIDRFQHQALGPEASLACQGVKNGAQLIIC